MPVQTLTSLGPRLSRPGHGALVGDGVWARRPPTWSGLCNRLSTRLPGASTSPLSFRKRSPPLRGKHEAADRYFFGKGLPGSLAGIPSAVFLITFLTPSGVGHSWPPRLMSGVSPHVEGVRMGKQAEGTGHADGSAGHSRKIGRTKGDSPFAPTSHLPVASTSPPPFRNEFLRARGRWAGPARSTGGSAATRWPDRAARRAAARAAG